MLKPASDRLNYGHLLRPPPDYQVDFALGTTYSLDLEALVGISMALFLSEEMNKSMVQNPIVVLDGLRRSADHFALLHEAGQIKVPQHQHSVYSLLENSVFAVMLPKDHSFHPKTWLIRYHNQATQPLYRLIVMSRNLTFDRSWDVAVCLEGTLNKGQADAAGEAHINTPLIDFVKFLRRHVVNRKKSNRISRMIEELRLIQFSPLDQHMRGLGFFPLGIPGYRQPPAELFETYKDLLIISPFLSKGTVKEFDCLSLTNSTKVLITRRSEISKLSPELLKSFQVFAMKEMVVEGEEGLSGEELEEEVYQNQDIHAKFYARSKNSQHCFFIGSANCSASAFHGNVEFLLQLHYRKWGFRLEHLLTDLFGKDDRENPFERIETLPELDEIDTTLADLLEKSIHQLCRTHSKATVQQQGNHYQVTVEFAKIPEHIDFTISPLAGLQQVKLDKMTIIYHLQLDQLGEFYKITATRNVTSVQRIIKIKTSDIPEERDKAIFKSIIKDSETFMKYVAYLLSDSLLITSLEQVDAERLGSVKWNSGWLQTPAFYENMLKTISREPERLAEIDRVIQMIDEPELIPEKFIELYNVFLQAAKKVKK